MNKSDPNTDTGRHEPGTLDLARRLAQFRRRVEAEGRRRSARMIDRAIADAISNSGQHSGKPPEDTS
jgi:hypothetical protein